MNSSNQNVFDILRLISAKNAPVGPTEISYDLQLPLTSVYRAFSTLEAAGYIKRHQLSPKYELTSMGPRLAKTFLSSITCSRLIYPYLQQLSYATEETTSLYVPIQGKLIRAASVQGTHEPIAHRPIGENIPRFSNTASHLLEIIQCGMAEAEYICHASSSLQEECFTKRYRQVKTTQICTSPGPDIESAEEASILIRLNQSTYGAITIEGPILEENSKIRDNIFEQCVNIAAKAEAHIISQIEKNPTFYDLLISPYPTLTTTSRRLIKVHHQGR